MKKKIFMFTMVACLVILSIAGSSLAYFTDTDSKTTVFTSGNVDITLAVTPTEETNIFPGVAYEKLATVARVNNSEDAFVGLTIDLVGALGDIISLDGTVANTTAIANIIQPGNGYTAKYTEITDGFRVFIVVDNALTASSGSVAVPFTVNIPAIWDADDAATFTAATFTTVAYATQTVGFSENVAAVALKTAFADVWGAYPAN